MESDLRLVISKIDLKTIGLRDLVKLIVESELLMNHKKIADKRGVYKPDSEAFCSFIQARLPAFYKEIERRDQQYGERSY